MLIPVVLGGETYFDRGVPCVRGGYPGVMESDQLEKRTGIVDTEDEHTEWVEYWLNDQLVHRSVDMIIKRLPPGFEAFGEVANFL